MIQDTLSKVVYTADGLQRQWDVPFQFNDSKDLHIYLTDDGVRVEEVFQNFEFNKEGNYFIYPTEESGLAPLEAGKQILILRETPNTQLEDSSEIYFKSKDVERGLDKLTMQVQELARDSYRAVKVSHFDTTSPEDFTEMLFEEGAKAEAAAAAAATSASNASLSEQNAASSKLSAEQASASATASAELAQSAADNSLQYAERAENAAAGSAASAVSSAESASLAQDLLNQVSESIYSKTEIDAKVSGLQAEIDLVESYIPSGTNDTNTLVNKQQLLDEEMDIREDLNQGLSELQTQITAQAAAITNKQEKLIAGSNITIDGNVISATGGGGGTGAEVEPATEEQAGIISISTSEEAREGFDDTTAMTPLKTAQVIYDNIGRAIQLGFDGTLSGNVLTFEPDTDTAYELKTGYNYTIDLLFPAVVADGTLDENISIVINNNGESIKIVNALNDDVDTDITVGNMKQIMKYTTDIGFRWIFNARFTTTQDGTKVFVMPSTVVNVQEGASVPDNVYTEENLVAGENVTFDKESGTDDNTIALFHFDGDAKDVVSGNEFSESPVIATEGKFGTGSLKAKENWFNSVSFAKSIDPKTTSFTLEFWHKQVSGSVMGDYGDETTIVLAPTAPNDTASKSQWVGLYMLPDGSNNRISLQIGDSRLGQFNTGSYTTLGEWNHYALTWDASTHYFKLYMNGTYVDQYQYYYYDSLPILGGIGMFKYTDGNDGDTKAQMYVDELRFSDTVRYTATFEVATEAFPSDKLKTVVNVNIPESGFNKDNLLGGKDIEIIPEPVEGGIDEHTVACWHFDEDKLDVVGGEEWKANYSNITNAYAKFGGKSVYANKYVFSTGISASGLSGWTIDGWILFRGTENTQFATGSYVSNYISFTGLRADISPTRIILGQYRGAVDQTFTFDTALSTDTWYHLAVQLKDGKFQAFINGKKVAEIDWTTAVTTNFGFYQGGYLDEVRISDVARYDGDFTPPTQAYRLEVPTGNYVINNLVTKTSQLTNDSGYIITSYDSTTNTLIFSKGGN